MTSAEAIPAQLQCPVDRSALRRDGPTWMSCARGHRYPVVEGVPVLLRGDVPQTMWLVQRSLELANEYARDPRAVGDPLFLDTIGVSPEEREQARKLAASPADDRQMDPVVSIVIAATSGYLYKHLVGRLDTYPIPELRMPPAPGTTFLDIGCNWGRWSIAAARKGYRVVGIDPSLGAVLAAKRLASRLGLDIGYVCGDARYLPFADAQFERAFSYSVLQHFSKADALAALDEVARVLAPEGECLIQMAHVIGARSLYHQARRGFREPTGFEVRYWTTRELRRAFAERFREVDASVHCFFGLGLEPSDLALVRSRGRTLIRLSEGLRRLSRPIPALRYFADSLYLRGVSPARASAPG